MRTRSSHTPDGNENLTVDFGVFLPARLGDRVGVVSVPPCHWIDGGHVDFGQGAVSDAGTTTVTAANASGEEVSVAAYALGFTGDVGVTAEQQRLRAELSRLIKNSLDQVPDTARMDPTQLAVLGLDQGSVDRVLAFFAEKLRA